MRDAVTDALLDSQTVTGFQGGQYWRWRVSGHVKLKAVSVTGVNAVVSGLFFDTGSSNPPPAVTLTAPLEGASYPAPATIGLAANATDGDGINRVEFYQALGQGQPTLIGQPVTTSPYQLTWNNVAAGSYTLTAKAYDALGASTVSAPVHVTVSTPGGGTSAAFIGTDATTQGSWRGVYGADGYHVINDTVSYPAYATVTPSGQAAWTWASSTSDGRALQKAAGADRIAATWYGGVFSIDVNVTDGGTHQVAVYAVDWDGGGRSETIEMRDAATNGVLDTRTLSGFGGGRYLLWNVSGHVVIRVTNLTGPNAVVAGLFFGGGGSTGGGASAAFIGTDTTTQGSWRGCTGRMAIT
jgi:hypothetical protein